MNVIDPKLLELIRCPVDGQSLVQASPALVDALNQRIQQGEVRDRSDGLVEEMVEAALVTGDGSRVHPVRHGIPTLIPGEAIELPEPLRSMVNR